MEIEDVGEVRTFEPMPKEGTLYMTAVRYSGNFWAAGPSAMDKAEVIMMLGNLNGVDRVRIYSVKVPLEVPSA